MVKALHLGPWFISGKFLSVRKWEPKFVPQEATLTSIAIWIRLPQLPTEFYDKDILVKFGRNLGNLLKIDQCTSSTLKGRYARICIQVPLETPVETIVIIGDHKHAVIYEGEGTLCTICGRIGHTAPKCIHKTHTSTTSNGAHEVHQKEPSPKESEWKTVTFPRRRKHGQPKTIISNEGERPFLRFHPGQSEGDTDSAKSSTPSQGDGGSFEQGRWRLDLSYGSRWPTPIAHYQ
uniref:Uncharacterized protein LOC104244065 n=1 Tax=Nicotiana sylvestris TaxID=4096 RepID=A0A1U7Y6V5_NICSY|nr:PREDICTED: uncharacterized protein LOC104244065 [Nicotiana sylvestris]